MEIDPWVEGGVAFSEDATLIRKEFKTVYASIFREIMDWLSLGTSTRTKTNTILRESREFIRNDRLGRLDKTETGKKHSTMQIVMMAARHGNSLREILKQLKELDIRLNSIREMRNFSEVRSVMIDHVAFNRNVSSEDRALMVDTVISSVISKYSSLLANVIAQIQRVRASIMMTHARWMDRLQHEAHNQGFDISNKLSEKLYLPTGGDDRIIEECEYANFDDAGWDYVHYTPWKSTGERCYSEPKDEFSEDKNVDTEDLLNEWLRE